jgi:hypothetical protein
MSTELRNVPNTDLSQTRFYGGAKRGTCIQVTSSDGKQFLQLTREQADQLARELALFANAEEVVYEDDDDDGNDGIQCYINGMPVTSKEFVKAYS